MTADAMGGVWTYALELIAGLATQDVEVSLAVLGPGADEDQLRDAARAGVASIHENVGALEWMDDPWRDLDGTGDWLLDLEGRLRPDVVHLNSFVHAAAGWHAPVVSVGHSCVLSWWRAVKGEDAPRSWGRYRDAVREGLEAAAEVVAPTRWMLAELTRLYGIDRGRVIYNGLCVPNSRGTRAREVVAAGRLWDEAKNVGAVLKVAPQLKWPVVVAGAEVVPMSNVEAVGRIARAELLARLVGASVFVLPARYEPFGLGALEAALSGCALVLGDIPSLREVWGDAAVFVDPDDPADLLTRCNDLLSDPEALEGWAERARLRASTYTTAVMTESYVQVYREVAPRAASTAGAGA